MGKTWRISGRRNAGQHEQSDEAGSENAKQMEENQKALEEKEFTAAAGGGAVEVTVSGKREITKVKALGGGCRSG